MRAFSKYCYFPLYAAAIFSISMTVAANAQQIRPAQNAKPSQSYPRANPETTPFNGPGFRIGTMRGTIQLEQQLGYSTNLSARPNGKSGFFSQTGGELSLISDWRRHELRLQLDGNYRMPFNGDEPTSTEINASTAFRMDLRDGFTLTPSLNYSASTQAFSDPTAVSGAVDNPLVQEFGADLEVGRDTGRYRMALRGEISSQTYEDAKLANGTAVDQSDLDNVEYSVTARLGYRVSPALIPFIQLEAAAIRHDQKLDRNGTNRDSNILGTSVGTEFNISEKLTGEIGVGFFNQKFEDASLSALNGFTIDGAILWSPYRNTQVSLDFATTSNASTTAGQSGSITYSGRLGVERNISSRLSASAFVGAAIETQGRESTTLEAGVGAEYHINRALAVTADVEMTNFNSSDANSDYNDISVRMGLKWER